MEDVNKVQIIYFSLSKLKGSPKEINSREIDLHLLFSANWNKRDKLFVKTGIHFTSLPLRSSMLKLPNTGKQNPPKKRVTSGNKCVTD